MKFAFALVLAALVAGCSMPLKVPERRPAEVAFPGISSEIPPDRPLDIVVVHGMCTHYPDWAERAAKDMLLTLGAEASSRVMIDLGPDASGIHVFQQTYPVGRRAVRISAVLWSPLTVPLKKSLCYDQSAKSPICKASDPYPFPRATANRLLKDRIMDDCLSDAMIYQGRSRDQINEHMQMALTRIATDPAAPVVLVTDSLGSKVTFDAIDKMISGTHPARSVAGRGLRDRITHVFMRANQIPILRLADLDLEGKPSTSADGRSAYAADPISAVFDQRVRKIGDRKPFVIAFSDPNDLLSYGIPAEFAKSYTLVNVYVSNQDTYFGFVERPDTTHTMYSSAPAVRQLMSCGTGTSPCAPDAVK